MCMWMAGGSCEDGSSVHWRLAKRGPGSIAQLRGCLRKRERDRLRSVSETDEIFN
jgi:hypothetical protein